MACLNCDNSTKWYFEESGVNRLTIEQEITSQNDIVDHLQLLMHDLVENPDLLSIKGVVKALEGISVVHKMRNGRLLDNFAKLCDLDGFKKSMDGYTRKACKKKETCYNSGVVEHTT